MAREKRRSEKEDGKMEKEENVKWRL